MNEVELLETLKAIKREAKFLYSNCRTLYEQRIRTSLPGDRKIFQEAISALDGMYEMYERLKAGMREESLAEQIKFATKWSTYLSCIEAMTAYKTKDKYLLKGITLDESYAVKMAPRLYLDYGRQLQQSYGSK